MTDPKKNTPLYPWNASMDCSFPIYLTTENHTIAQRLFKYLKLNPEANYNHDHDELSGTNDKQN